MNGAGNDTRINHRRADLTSQPHLSQERSCDKGKPIIEDHFVTTNSGGETGDGPHQNVKGTR
jgi:hypothetical protein